MDNCDRFLLLGTGVNFRLSDIFKALEFGCHFDLTLACRERAVSGQALRYVEFGRIVTQSPLKIKSITSLVFCGLPLGFETLFLASVVALVCVATSSHPQMYCMLLPSLVHRK